MPASCQESRLVVGAVFIDESPRIGGSAISRISKNSFESVLERGFFRNPGWIGSGQDRIAPLIPPWSLRPPSTDDLGGECRCKFIRIALFDPLYVQFRAVHAIKRGWSPRPMNTAGWRSQCNCKPRYNRYRLILPLATFHPPPPAWQTGCGRGSREEIFFLTPEARPLPAD